MYEYRMKWHGQVTDWSVPEGEVQDVKIPIQINENSAEPLYHQIENQLRSLIITGQLGREHICRPFVSSPEH